MLVKDRKAARNRAFASQLRDYLGATLHLDVQLDAWDGERRLPQFLGHRYGFLTGNVVRQPCLFAVDSQPEDGTPAQIGKHLSTIGAEFPGLVVYAAPAMSATRRARMVDAGIAFVVPGNQLYIPALAVDLRETFRSPGQRSADTLSPAAQATMFYAILFRDELASNPAKRTPSQLASVLGYSQMSVGRAIDELASLGLATVDAKGRQKFLSLHEPTRTFIEENRKLLRSPVRSRKFVICQPDIPPLKIAGESALAHLTGLAPPDIQVFALHHEDWKLVSGEDTKEVRSRDSANTMIELWHYRPDVLSEYASVDPFSLYAQFWNHPNERIAQSARDALEQSPW